MGKRERAHGVHLQCLLNGGQDVFEIRESEEAFSDDQFFVYPYSKFAYFTSGVKSGFNSGSLAQVFRHPDGIAMVVQSNQAVFDDHFLQCMGNLFIHRSIVRPALQPFINPLRKAVNPLGRQIFGLIKRQHFELAP